MRSLIEAAYLSRVAGNAIVFFVFFINLLPRKLGSKFRIRRIPKLKMNIHGATYFVNTWDGLLVVRPSHEPAVHRVLKNEAEQTTGGLFVNVGAHIGRYCFEFAKYFDKTVAFEPTKSTFALLEEGWRLHPRKDSIFLMNKGLSDSCGSATLLVSQDESKNSIVASEDCPTEGYEAITLSTLDHDLPDAEKSQLRLLLVDVEGAEESVLRGADETLRTGSPVIVIELLNETVRARCDAFLTALGYSGKQLDRTNWEYRKTAGLAETA